MDGLYTYALVSTLYDEKQDYIHCFIPFVVSVVDSRHSNTAQQIQGRILGKYKLHIPIHSVRTIAKHATRKKYLETKDKTYNLTLKGEVHSKEINQHEKTKTDMQKLFSKLAAYIKDHGYDQTKVDVEVHLEEYVYDNLKSLQFITSKVFRKVSGVLSSKHEIAQLITDFLIDIETNDEDVFDIFKGVVHGKIIAIAIGGLDNIAEIKHKFSDTKLFLDTNIIFNILGFHGQESQDVTLELIKLAKKTKKFSFHVFDFTIKEIIRVLENYSQRSQSYFAGVQVDSIYSYMKELGWKEKDLMNFINNVEERLEEQNITLISVEEKEQDEEYTEFLTKIQKYKPFKSNSSYAHDLQAVFAIKRMRKTVVRKFEKSRYFFLSQDARLSRFNYVQLGHRKNQTIPEVILELTLTNLLWLKEPKDIPLNALITFHKKYAIVNKNTWEMFHEMLLQSAESNSNLINYTATLVCYSQLQSTLALLGDEANVENIESVVKASAEMLRRENDSESEKQLKEKTILIATQLSRQFASERLTQDQQIRDLHRETVYNQMRHVRKLAKKEAGKLLWCYRILAIVAIIILIGFSIKPVTDNWSDYDALFTIAMVVVPVICLILGFSREKMLIWLYRRLYNYRLKVNNDKANIDELTKKLGQ